ncbi:serine/threonine-protein phosphatase 7 long form-like protein [Gossypium australe]|uniref:Serine/threonine-protein phosphatase 7 long form-like protein n=1 Tax=Gossypium australe TaxID=47621 RepID=A0A5B6WPG0_9ROSI|nr:serine/threonine-protein phosphatase 7 long form-like protein [Gossypium australe]
MYRATQPRKIKIGGCILLLQSWARYPLPFLRIRANYPYTFPLITRSEDKFECTPYEDLTIREVITEEFFVNTWYVKVSLLVYDIVEMHEIDKVLR